ncbi:HAD family phosphatase [Streptomyces sp. ID05-04B]|uniref:HAD family hydrolase n=1 Tax=Streptomyces sp. ID05-04B TaxID=3028661 RepID=UPI0029C1452D|nr:HAD family phosphatase [Streptomyces sp. ID05-04B]MDX5565524.1 HAD family phosphatase [Streptomyces sp. ID05-04B]
MKPRVFFFDLGGVVCRFHRERRLEILGEACGLPAEKVDEELYSSGLISSWDGGAGNAQEVEGEIRRRLGYPGTSAELRRVWCGAFEPDPDVLAAADLVRSYRTALFTDNDALLLSGLPRQLAEVDDRFDALAFSCVLRATKPTPEAFAGALGLLDATAEEAFFVDDREANVRAARALGITAVLFEGGPALYRTLEGLLGD